MCDVLLGCCAGLPNRNKNRGCPPFELNIKCVFEIGMILLLGSCA